MNTHSCTRRWQAEAIEEGRLSESEAAAFTRHAASCESCAREQRALKALQAAVAELPALSSSDLERRRLRNELMRRADLQLRAPQPARRTALAYSLALVACATLVWTLGSRWLQPVRAPAAKVSEPSYRIIASDRATWRTSQHGPTLRLAAQRGSMEIAVDKLHSGQRFLLSLPDGELEVKGTRFVVEVGENTTERVAVSEGRVVLRVKGEHEYVLGAGETWASSVKAQRPEHSSPVPVPAPVSVPMPQPEKRAAPSPVKAEKPHGHDAAVSETTRPSEDAGAQLGGTRFADAMRAFSVGDYARADTLFVEFEREHPDDARVEDALFLRTVASARRGDARARSELARRYLERYPLGLRRADAERMAQPE